MSVRWVEIDLNLVDIFTWGSHIGASSLQPLLLKRWLMIYF
jgi:hypothetical protein